MNEHNSEHHNNPDANHDAGLDSGHHAEHDAEHRPGRQRTWPSILAIVAVVGAMIWLGQFAGRHFSVVEEMVADLGPLGPLLFVAVYLIIVPLCFPVSILGFSAGALFGMVLGTVIVVVAGLLAAAIMFYLARRFFRERILAHAAQRPRLARFLELADRDAPRWMVLLRLSPLNFGLACYMLGASRVRFALYMLGSLCILPSALLQVYLGYAARRLGRVAGGLDAPSRGQDILVVIGVVASIVLIVVVGNLARQALRTAGPTGDVENEIPPAKNGA